MVPGADGGIKQLCDLVDEFGDELEADFTQFYQLDIADVWRGQLSPRRVLVLAGQLGTVPGSRFRALTLGGADFVGWTRDSEILADVHDAIVDNSLVTSKVAGGKPGAPTPYPRPLRKEDRPQTVDVPSIDDFPIHMVVAMTSQK